MTSKSLATDALKLTVKRKGVVDHLTCLTKSHSC